MSESAAVTDPIPPNEYMQSLQRQVEELQRQVAERDKQLQQLQQSGPETPYRTTTKKPTWLFEVTPFRKDLVQLTPVKGHFVDESEAIRCFWVVNQNKRGLTPKGDPMNLDSTTVAVTAVCLERRERCIRMLHHYLRIGEETIPVHIKQEAAQLGVNILEEKEVLKQHAQAAATAAAEKFRNNSTVSVG